MLPELHAVMMQPYNRMTGEKKGLTLLDDMFQTCLARETVLSANHSRGVTVTT